MNWIGRNYLQLLVAVLAIGGGAVAGYFALCPFCGGILMPPPLLNPSGKIGGARVSGQNFVRLYTEPDSHQAPERLDYPLLLR